MNKEQKLGAVVVAVGAINEWEKVAIDRKNYFYVELPPHVAREVQEVIMKEYKSVQELLKLTKGLPLSEQNRCITYFN